MRPKKPVGIYTRVSTSEQSTDSQRSELLDFVRDRGWQYRLYEDHGHSGATDDRPALKALMADVRKRQLSAVVVSALDRLARSLKQLLNIAEELKDLGVDLIALKQNIDTSSAAGKLTYVVLAAVAEFERDMLRERVRAGMAQARRRGARIGRPASRELSRGEIEALTEERRRTRASYRSLGRKFQISASRAFLLCRDAQTRERVSV